MPRTIITNPRASLVSAGSSTSKLIITNPRLSLVSSGRNGVIVTNKLASLVAGSDRRKI